MKTAVVLWWLIPLVLILLWLSACSRQIDPLLTFGGDAYLLQTSKPVSEVPEVTKADLVVVIWFSESCVYCKTELADLQANMASLQAGNLSVVGVAVASPRERLVRMVKDLQITFPIVVEKGNSPVGAVPYTVLVKNGEIIDQWIGYVATEAIIAAVR